MLPIEALSRFRANLISAPDAWQRACTHLHESIGWSALLAHALKSDPSLHPQLYAILSKPTAEDKASIAVAFEELKVWCEGKTPQELAPALALWAAQTQIEQYTVHDLVKATSLGWRWEMAIALMPESDVRPEHNTLVHVLWMDHQGRNQSSDQQVEPSILSTVFSP